MQNKVFYRINDHNIFTTVKSPKSIFFTLLFCLFFNLNNYAQTLEDCIKIKESGLAAMDKFDYAKALQDLTKAKLLAEKNNWYLQIFETKNKIGVVYMNLSDYGEALNYYLEAYTVATKHLESNKESAILNNIAVLYCLEKKYKKAQEYYLKAYDIAKKLGDKNKLALYGVNLGKVSNWLNELDVASDYLNEAAVFAKGNEPLELQVQAMLAENLLCRGEFEAGKKIAFDLQAKNKENNFENRNINSTILNLLARAFFLEKDYEKCVYYINLCLKATRDLEGRMRLYDQLSDVYVLQKKDGKALAALRMMVSTRDSLDNMTQKNVYETNKVKFDVLNYKNDLNISREKSRFEHKIFGVSIVFFILLLFFLFRMHRNRIIKQEQKKIIIEREQKIINLELESEKSNKRMLEQQIKEIESEALLEQERLKNEIEQKNRKLSAKALYLSGRNDMIEEVVNSLSEIPNVSQDNTLKSHIKSLKEHLKSNSEWDNFIIHFEEVNQGFLNCLKEKHPNLTANDIRFICYVYMNLSSKEICSIFNITQEACRKRKERIFNKMEIDKSMSFYEYLSRISR
jgi:tetratricopeptide (TPR) repeat protein